MPFIADTALVRLGYSFGPEVAVNTFGVLLGSPLDETHAGALDSLFISFDDDVKTQRNSHGVIKSITVIDNSAVGAPRFVFEHDNPGTASAGALPLQICGLISLRTSNFTRAGRGRSYVPYPDQGKNDTDAQLGGIPTTGYISTVEGAVATLIAGLDADGDALVVISGFGGGTAFVVDTFHVDKRWAVQRRRANKIPLT